MEMKERIILLLLTLLMMALRGAGDSMTPLLHSGDVVLVDLDAAVPPGGIAVGRHPDHGSVVKRVLRADGGALRLVSLNPAYPPLELPAGSGVLLGPVVVNMVNRTARQVVLVDQGWSTKERLVSA